MKNDNTTLFILVLLIIATLFFVPWLIQVIWNWQFSDIYVLSYGQTFWLYIIVSLLQVQVKTNGD